MQTPEQALALAREIALAPGLVFGGLMTYPPGGKWAESDAWLSRAIALFKQEGIAVPRVTSGNSPDMWRGPSEVVTERRPGTYIYFDRTQVIEAAAPLDVKVGDQVRIIPNHACVVSNLFDVVHLVRGDEVVATERVAARGRVA